VQHNHATVTFALPPSTASELSIENLIGEVTALASIAIAVALDERRRGRVSHTSKQRGGDLIAALYDLQQKYAGDFDTIAREYGKRVLTARYAQAKNKMNGACPQFDEAIAAEMISWPLAALADVTRAEMN
jgi:hypothetical protein